MVGNGIHKLEQATASTGIVTGYAWGQKVWSLELSDNICILSMYQNLKLLLFFKGKDLRQDVS